MFRSENRNYIFFSAAAVLLSLIGIVWFFVLFIGDAELEKAAQAEIAERTGSEQFTIEFIEERKYGKKHKRNHVTIGYTVEGSE
ncbi:hypothetical protein [Halobacillus salinus]|uniref:hypothetical protein n=1 Tax=Halobacillus salinus TaxID=192814 RepID=UPI0009A5D5AF|nr:hypothetical protein [Halobacillus salinus]